MIYHAAELLPGQGPISVFIHHNPLHAFEHLPFYQAVELAARQFGCASYLPENHYREELRKGRIRLSDVEEVLSEDLQGRGEEKVFKDLSRFELRLAMLQYPLCFGPTEELLWFVAETDALRRLRPDASVVVRTRLLAETRRWVMRDLRNGYKTMSRSGTSSLAVDLSDLLERFGEANIEKWSESTWEAFTLQALWRICCAGAARVPPAASQSIASCRLRDLLLEVAGVDADCLVHEILIPFCAAFLDQGLARWPLPQREKGFFHAFWTLYHLPVGPPDPWRRELAAELQRLYEKRIEALEAIRESLDLLGIGEEEWHDLLVSTLLALRGWAGMIHFLEKHPERAVHAIPRGSLLEFLAIRLILDRLALRYLAETVLSFRGPLNALRDHLRARAETPRPHSVEQRAFLVFQLAQVLGWTPADLLRLSPRQWTALLQDIEAFSALERRRLFHRAYERRFALQALDALAVHNQCLPAPPKGARFQAIFCIDEREESMRRHLEELVPDCETFGMAGYFYVPMYYRGAGDAHFVPLCPAGMRPRHWVVEQVAGAWEQKHRRRALRRRTLALASHYINRGSRSFGLGAMAALGGVFASIPLIARTFFPRLAAGVRKGFERLVRHPRHTNLILELGNTKRDEDAPDADSQGGSSRRTGFLLSEMIDIAENALRDIGLTSRMARLILIIGHGSTSLNNPHESAHDCGACGGAPGGANARALAQMLNDPRVRERLRERGLVIPRETVFVGGLHNTSSESLSWYDLDKLPPSHRQEFEEAEALVRLAAEHNAHERCRRFESAALTLSPSEARRHVEARAEDLAQVRPEWGHATNALCVIGRRDRTRGLFLDRRAFLVSYDPTQDDGEASVLTRILLTAVPVCAGINLEYFFSFIDNSGYGCGTKLPHNIAALVGVMDGASSDLRTGLPWQMVEIHEPIRILFVVETTPDTMLRILHQKPSLGRLVRNGWVQLATLDPSSPRLHLWRDGQFYPYHPTAQHLPQAASSLDWYRGWREHLDFARIQPHFDAELEGSHNHDV